MKFETSIEIAAPKEKIWGHITDIDNSVNMISGIEDVEVLERPDSGIVGLKWRETRTLFGKQATEVMWITEAEENHYYKTRAENHGMVYVSTLRLEEIKDKVELTMTFDGEAQKLISKIMGWIMTPIFKKATQKALEQDLKDIQKTAEEK